jgi:hypothetical protein
MSSPRVATIPASPDEGAIRNPRALAPVLSLDIRRYVRVHVTCMIVLVVLCFAGQYCHFVLHHDRVFGLIRDFDLDEEANVPTWFETATLVLAAALLEVAARVNRSVRDDRWVRWRVLSSGFLFMSLDELASIHERFRLPFQMLRNVPKFWAFSWVVPAAVLVVVAFSFFLPWLRKLPERTRNGLLLAGAVYVAGAVGLETAGGIVAMTVGMDNWTYVATYTLEETMEMTGCLLLIVTMLRYLRSLHPVPTLEITSGPRPAAVTGGAEGSFSS